MDDTAEVVKDDNEDDGNSSFEFRKELATLLNRYSMENRSNTPDFILAGYLHDCLETFDWAIRRRTEWYKRE